jgi:hypothetical protein
VTEPISRTSISAPIRFLRSIARPLAIAQSGGVPDFTVPYYEIDLGGFLFSVPTVQGHYNFSFVQFLFGNAPGISFQTQVAP